MNIYLVKRTDKIGYDESAAFVIRADNETLARAIAASESSDEGNKIWRNSLTTVTLIGIAAGPITFNPGVVLEDHRAG